MLRRIFRSATAIAFAASLFTASAPLALADTSTQGPDSGVFVNSKNNSSVNNNNNVNVSNSNYQTATTGDANVSHNTTGGSATSGNATNNNQTDTSIQISNISSLPSGGGGGNNNISTSGPNSPVHINRSNDTQVNNNNNVSVWNSNYQKASTGNANVSNNTAGGSANSGNATNNNNTTTSVSINNGGQGGGGQGGGQQNNGSGQGGGQVLSASTIASLAGGQGAVTAAQLPNTGLHEGMSPWIAITILTLLSSAAYWRLAIAPRLKA